MWGFFMGIGLLVMTACTVFVLARGIFWAISSYDEHCDRAKRLDQWRTVANNQIADQQVNINILEGKINQVFRDIKAMNDRIYGIWKAIERLRPDLADAQAKPVSEDKSHQVLSWLDEHLANVRRLEPAPYEAKTDLSYVRNWLMMLQSTGPNELPPSVPVSFDSATFGYLNAIRNTHDLLRPGQNL